MTRVPLFDLRPYNRDVLQPLCGADLHDLVEGSDFTGGRWVNHFEEEWATFTGQGHCVGMSSGLDALRLALAVVGCGRGDDVIVPAMTFVATWEAVTQTGAQPVPVDVDGDGLIDPQAVAAAVTSNTWTVVPVHLYGQMADMQTLCRLSHDNLGRRLRIVEDAAQAHGAQRDGYKPGEFSDAVAYSFYPTKPLGAWGDAGAVTTNLGFVDSRLRTLREHGQRSKNDHVRVGWTARLDTLQALVLSHKLPALPEMGMLRHQLALAYTEHLDGVGDLRLPSPRSNYAWHLYAIRTEKPELLADWLRDRGVGTGRHYPVPPHLQPAYQHLGYKPGQFPVAEAIAAQTLSLPLWPGMTEQEQDIVVTAVRDYFTLPKR